MSDGVPSWVEVDTGRDVVREGACATGCAEVVLILTSEVEWTVAATVVFLEVVPAMKVREEEEEGEEEEVVVCLFVVVVVVDVVEVVVTHVFSRVSR